MYMTSHGLHETRLNLRLVKITFRGLNFLAYSITLFLKSAYETRWTSMQIA